jgi:hypothetical protein
MSRMCQACEDGAHAYCRGQTWCECECDPESIFDDPDPYGETEWPDDEYFNEDD